MYSQPSPDLRHPTPKRPDQPAAPSTFGEVSPPSSPDMYAGPESQDRRRSPSISPVDDGRSDGLENRTPGRSRFDSHIPVLGRRKQSVIKGRSDFVKVNRLDVDTYQPATRWGDYLREPMVNTSRTPSNVGRRPYEHHEETSQPRADLRSGLSKFVPRGTQGSGSTSMKPAKDGRKAIRTDLNAGIVQEESNSANRSRAPVPTIEKRLPTEPLVPVLFGNNRTPSPPRDSATGRESPLSAARTLPLGTNAVLPNRGEDDDIKPTVPLKLGRKSPSYGRTISSGPHADSSEPSNSTGKTVEDNITSSTQTMGYDFRSALRGMTLQQQPVSHFSFSTHTTGTTPNTPEQKSIATFNTSSPAASILDRPRPHMGSPAADTMSIKRKPAPSRNHTTTPASDASSRFSKSLPQSPPEVESVDLVTSLQAQLNDYSFRRGNLQKIIRDLTEGVPQHSSSVQAREDVKRKVDKCKTELAEVQKQEHVLGLRLHRAWKRNDSQAYYEPTGLWVRRVTG
ncbi:MAG: hypothetical protein M1837_005280 [Sclerophora amabilis]|nr:MAG: hypothetical protein M1837_005280 [Sclerophora amabilis]